IFIVQKEHYDKYNLKHLLNVIAPRCSIITVDSVTDGAACTTLLAEHLINSNNPLLICNSDQFVELDSNQFFYSVSDPGIDGAILTHNSTHPKWSYCEVDEYGWVRRVAEKEVISNYANVGWYYWQRGSDYVKYAKQMIDKDIRVRGEYYVAPVTNEAVQDGKKIKIFPCERMWGCGDPESFEYLLENYEGNI